MEVAERDVVDAVEDAGGDAGDPTHADVALGVARLGAGDERVREDDRAGPAHGRVGPHPAHGLLERGLVGPDGEAPRLGHGVRVEVGDAVHRHGPVVVGEQHGRADAGGVGPQVDAGGVDQPGAEAEPQRGVVVAAGEHHAGAGAGQPGQGVVGQPHGVDRRQRAVVDVAGDHHGVDPLALDHLEQVVDEGSLVRQHAFAVEGPAQVPVGGVEQAHVTNLGPTTDTRPEPTPERLRCSGRCAPRG